jgi:hypothetical protein
MRVTGERFDGGNHSLNTNERLRAIAGDVFWFTEYQPVNTVRIDTLHYLLMEFFRHHICCHLSGSDVAHTTGTLYLFRAGTLYIAMTDTPLLYLIFQQGSEIIESSKSARFAFVSWTRNPKSIYIPTVFLRVTSIS